MSASISYKISFVTAALDLILATFFATNGDSRFVWFIILAGIMYGYGLYFKALSAE